MKTNCWGCQNLKDLSTLSGLMFKCQKGKKVTIWSGHNSSDYQVYSEDCDE